LLDCGRKRGTILGGGLDVRHSLDGFVRLQRDEEVDRCRN
jgi:hypothetical protein